IGDPRDTEAEAGIADVVDDHIPRIAARSLRWRAAVFRSCRTRSNRSGLTAPLPLRTHAPGQLSVQRNECVSTTARRPGAAQGAERVRTLEACSVRRPYRVRLPPLGAACCVGDRCNRPPLL